MRLRRSLLQFLPLGQCDVVADGCGPTLVRQKGATGQRKGLKVSGRGADVLSNTLWGKKPSSSEGLGERRKS